MESSLPELLARQAALDHAIEEARAAARAQALIRVHQLMAEYGLTSEDFTVRSNAHLLIGRKVKPKYRDPASGVTWTGRGLKPKWMRAALSAGSSIEDFKIRVHEL